jgi:hypothetical protein
LKRATALSLPTASSISSVMASSLEAATLFIRCSCSASTFTASRSRRRLPN